MASSQPTTITSPLLRAWDGVFDGGFYPTEAAWTEACTILATVTKDGAA
jgi:hypothetical protein